MHGDKIRPIPGLDLEFIEIALDYMLVDLSDKKLPIIDKDKEKENAEKEEIKRAA